MELAGAIVAFPPLIILIQHTARSLQRCAKTISVARKDVSRLAVETNLFASLLENLQETMDLAGQTGEYGIIPTDTTCCTAIVRQGKQSMAMVERMLDKLDPLRSDTRCSRLETFIARGRWFFQAEDVNNVMLIMNSVKCSANLLVNILVLKQLVRRCGESAANTGVIPSELREKMLVVSNPLTSGAIVLISALGSAIGVK